ncbi:cell division protein FtsB [Mycetohabitans sp. B8]|uniref:cell division protein FtsB n=1 Tax=Mycetohabitans sp. B8 TaxID=2841845 RepID=UPI001F235447|nr:cell division protein FtsB [Mycetohabitans sp. B8]MCG1042620.1 cell division protein FtsB [Mycetohabitans sp. B8]
MRLVTVVLIGLIVLIQFPLWWGHGGWLHVHELQQQLAAQQKKNNDLKLRNERIAGEVQDLQGGTAAVEERARYEMGMIKDSEVFVQFVSPNASTVSATAAPSNMSMRGQVSAQPMRVVPNPEPRMPKAKASRAAKGSAVRRGDNQEPAVIGNRR